MKRSQDWNNDARLYPVTMLISGWNLHIRVRTHKIIDLVKKERSKRINK